MLQQFPSGDTTWKQSRPHSAWRDFKFMLIAVGACVEYKTLVAAASSNHIAVSHASGYRYNQATQAVEPALPLAQAIEEWNEISRSLAEAPHRRLSQLSDYFDEY